MGNGNGNNSDDNGLKGIFSSRITQFITTGVICFALGIFVGWSLLNKGTKDADISLKFGENELKIDLSQDLLDHSSLLNKLFSEQFSTDGARGWLKRQQKIYSPKDVEIVEPISELEYDHEVSTGLRDLSLKKVGPWSYQTDTIRIGIPNEEDQPPLGHANACDNGPLRSKYLLIHNEDYTEKIKVQATGHYPCPPGYDVADIQLNAEDAHELLGTSNFKKFEKAYVIIIQE